MVRWIWQNRLVQGALRFVRLFARWVLVWLSYFTRRLSRNMAVSKRVVRLLVRPRDPNNLFVAGDEASHEAPETDATSLADMTSTKARTTLLWAAGQSQPAAQSSPTSAQALSLWRGARKVEPDEALPGTAAANHRYAFIDLLSAQVKRLNPAQIADLDDLMLRLARKWLDIDEQFEVLPRRNRLDISETLRYNIPRYAGMVLNLKWATRERPVPQLAKPAKILVIGDVSHSMVHYVSIVLYFLHKLNFHFTIDSYVFSEHSTHAAPFLNGVGTFQEKVQRLVAGANSWNAGTRFGTALKEIAETATVDEHTYVIIATDGKVSLQKDEPALIEEHMTALKRRAKQIIFVTPSAEFSDGANGRVKVQKLGSFKYDFVEIPIFQVGPPLWYGTLGRYADRLYLVRTVQDLVDMTDDLILSSKSHD
ncbi:MAG TPA: VWA domain-containing protein [Symbiobacteriaceae bacterium]|nr:VWA domain-containing protein [Symbiobacteriaceae bacterium]